MEVGETEFGETTLTRAEKMNGNQIVATIHQCRPRGSSKDPNFYKIEVSEKKESFWLAYLRKHLGVEEGQEFFDEFFGKELVWVFEMGPMNSMPSNGVAFVIPYFELGDVIAADQGSNMSYK